MPLSDIGLDLNSQSIWLENNWINQNYDDDEYIIISISTYVFFFHNGLVLFESQSVCINVERNVMIYVSPNRFTNSAKQTEWIKH